MITICTGNGLEGYKFREFNKPEQLDDEVNAAEVFCLEASREELLFIAQHFTNLPTGPLVGKVASNTWFGDHAKFIAHNYRIYEFMKDKS